MTPTLTGISQTQPRIDDGSETKVSLRAAAIVIRKTADHTYYLLAANTTVPGMTAFINTTLSDTRDQHFTPAQIELRLREKIQERAGITNLTKIGELDTQIHRQFRKPTPQGGHNEDAVYLPGSIMIFETSEFGSEQTDSGHTPVRLTADQIATTFKSDGSNGSSYLIWDAYYEGVEELTAEEKENVKNLKDLSSFMDTIPS